MTNVRLKIKKKKNLPASSDLKKSGLRTNFFFFAWPNFYWEFCVTVCEECAEPDERRQTSADV